MTGDIRFDSYQKSKWLIILLLLLLFTGCSKVCPGCPVVYEYERKQSDHLFAYTVALPEDIRRTIEERYKYSSDSIIGYLLPVFVPDHKKNPITGEIFWCTIHDKNGKLKGYEQINVTEVAKGKRDIQFPAYQQVDKVDWEGIAGYTNRTMPMALYWESIYKFIVIGDTAYSLNFLPSRELAKTDSFTLRGKGLAVTDIMWASLND